MPCYVERKATALYLSQWCGDASRLQTNDCVASSPCPASFFSGDVTSRDEWIVAWPPHYGV